MNPAMAASHREAFMAGMIERGGGVAVLRTGGEKVRNRDVHYPFRPESDFWYLTGFPEPDAVAVLRPECDEGRYILFVRPKDPEMETWHGRRAGVAGARERYAADEAYSIEELDEVLPKLLKGANQLFYRTGEDTAFDSKLLAWLDKMQTQTRDGVTGPAMVVAPGLLLHEQRLIKSADELQIMRRAAAITTRAHRAAMEQIGPGTYEYEIEATVDGTFRRHGGWGPGYPTICAAGDNATILHYTVNGDEVLAGDLLLLDAGCEVDGYTADVTRTFPADGAFTAPQRELYEAVLDAQLAAIEQVRPGHTFLSVHEAALRVLVERMVAMGLVPGPVDTAIESEAYKKHYMHRTSHWLGIDVHDVGTYWVNGKASRPLEPGMVLTVEPGLYISADDEQAPPELRGLGIRIEDDVLVTESGHEVLTDDAPKTIEDVEAIC